VAVVTALAAEHVGGPPIVAAAGVLLAKALPGLIRDRIAESTAARAERFLERIAAELNDRYGPGLESHAALGETAADAMHKAGRAALDAVDPDVIPALASLAANYVDRPLDPFFRGATRILQELTHEELLELRATMQQVLDHTPKDVDTCTMKIAAALNGVEGDQDFTLEWWRGTRTAGFSGQIESWTAQAPSSKSLFRLLKINGLAEDLPYDSEKRAGPESISLSRSVAERLSAHLSAESGDPQGGIAVGHG
jgi:hypothetical protein